LLGEGVHPPFNVQHLLSAAVLRFENENPCKPFPSYRVELLIGRARARRANGGEHAECRAFKVKGSPMPKRPVFIPKQDRTEKPDPASQPDKAIKQDWGGTQPPVRSPVEPPVSPAG
jgi:hypothetical protein